jgi:RNA polymerase sigma factor (sigma-70 family)
MLTPVLTATVRSMTPDAQAPARDNDAWVRALADDGPGGEAARRDLRRILVAGLQRLLSSRGVAADLCEDFAQEALVRIRGHLPAFRGDSQFTTWALSIATRIAFDELRRKRWKDVPFEAASGSTNEQRPLELRADASQEKALLRERILSMLRDIIDHKLTHRQRAVLLDVLAGVPLAETTRALGIDRNTLYKLNHDARRRVKFHLDAAGVSAADVLWVFE